MKVTRKGSGERERERRNLQDLRENNKRSIICIIGILKGDKKESETERALKKIMAENFLNLVKDINIQIQEAE